MTPSNSNWVLHTMLFYYTRLVIEKQGEMTTNIEEEEDEEED